jgi:hypothetical protein
MIAPKGVTANAADPSPGLEWALMDFGRCISLFLAERQRGKTWRHRRARPGDLSHYGAAVDY